LRTTERFRRRDFGHIDLEVTFDDPQAYRRPWTVSFPVNLAPDTEMLEYVCNETESERYQLSGRSNAQKNVKMPPEILARYVGVYDRAPPLLLTPLLLWAANYCSTSTVREKYR
jgi:hypothetical protein